MILNLIRHGKTQGNAEKRYIGRTDELLSDEGSSELRNICYPPCDILAASPMKRCLMTADIIYPDMEKLIAISDLFGISLDELVLDKAPESAEQPAKSELYTDIKEKLLTDENKKKAKKGLKIAAIVFGALVLVDVISMIVYFSLHGFPK